MALLPKIRHILFPLCLGTWGCILLRLYLSGQLGQVQNPSYHNITLCFGLLLLALCVAHPFLFDPAEDCSPVNPAATAGRAAMLALPLASYLLLPQEFLTTDFLRKRSSVNLLSPAALQRFLPGKPGELHRLLLEQARDNPQDGVMPLDLLELIYLSQYRELRDLYNGQRVVIPGQWLSEECGHFKIARLLIFCCAADGRAVTLRINGETALREEGAWIEATGTLRFKEGSPAPEMDLIDYTTANQAPDAGR